MRKMLLVVGVAFCLGMGRAGAAQPFGPGVAVFHPTAVAPYSFVRTVVRVRFNVARGVVYGDETVMLRPKAGGLRSLPFDSAGIRFARVTVNGRAASFRVDDASQRVDVGLDAGVHAGAALTVEFLYSATPVRGVYFIRPDKSYPDVTPGIWTQGETTDNRRWFPTWDEPNEKTPSELIISVPRGWTVVGNGYLKSHVRTRTAEVWDWNSPRPKSTYLIAFAAGPLSKHHTSLGALDVDSFVQPADAKLNAICFGRTNQMIDFYQRIIGVNYPFEKYDQIAVERFTFGGMENSSATIVTANALHPAIEDVESSCDGLVSHELAQNWFGDDVTMSDWSNAWINEGFATYYDELWTGERYGSADLEYARYKAQQLYFSETTQYYRPIVDYVYGDPLSMFDASGHERPAQALHMLRTMFGDARFFGAVRTYLRAYSYKNASTDQFFASIGKSLGTNLDWFKNEWFYRAAYPHYYVSDSYDAAARVLTLRVRQKNHDGEPFRMPVVVEVYFGGRMVRVEPMIDRNDQVVRVPGIASKPQMVLFDANNVVLRELDYAKPVGDLAYQLAHARHVGDREWALAQLATFAGASGDARVAALRAVDAAVRTDRFYGVRSDAVAAAARFGVQPAAGDTVAAALHDPDKRVVIAAEGAAASLSSASPAVADALNGLVDDADATVAAAALQSLGALKVPGIYDRLVAALNRASFHDQVAAGALRGLAAYGDAAALPLIRARMAYGTPESQRNVAVGAYAQLSARVGQQKAAFPVLVGLVQHDHLISTRMAAADALGSLGDPAAIPVLERVERDDSQLLVRLDAWGAVETLKKAG